MKLAFTKRIDPQHLFKYLANYDMNSVDYEQTLNPVRYRHVLIQSILKQYIRENMYIGELEIEGITSPTKKSNQLNWNVLQGDEEKGKKGVSSP